MRKPTLAVMTIVSPHIKEFDLNALSKKSRDRIKFVLKLI